MNYWAAVVDDDVLNQKAAEKILGLHGYRVSCLASGEALLSFLQENQPDVILLDLHMDGIDGFETLRLLKLNEQVKDIPAQVGQCITLPQEEAFELYRLLHKLLDTINE